MPIYEYRCTACGHELEALQRFSDAPLATCPVCGKESLNKLLSAAGFQLKGSGWYATDFKNSGAKPAAKPAAATDGAAPAAAADAKPAADAKTESKGDAKPSEPAAKPAADKPAGATGSSTASS
jgi:putative FmdB family regulatory protein